jgi:hypothetical protein
MSTALKGATLDYCLSAPPRPHDEGPSLADLLLELEPGSVCFSCGGRLEQSRSIEAGSMAVSCGRCGASIARHSGRCGPPVSGRGG